MNILESFFVKNKLPYIFFFVILLNLFFNTQFQLHYDEAYYWVWSKNLSLSYFDHPPLIAYLIYLINFFGNSEFYIRLIPIITTIITLIIIYKFSNRIFNKDVANIALLLGLSSPLLQGALFVATIDSPLFMFWILSIYNFNIAIFEDKKLNIYYSGLFAGLGLLTKYTAFLIFPSILLFLLLSKEYRRYIVNPHVYLAFLLSISIFSPVIYWNYIHSWISFKFQLLHGIDNEKNINIHGIFDYLGGALLVVSPIILISFFYYNIKYIKLILNNNKLLYLFCCFIFGFVFFGYFSLYKHTEANWPGPVYLSAIILLSWFIDYKKQFWIQKFAFIFIIIVLFITKLPLIFIPQYFHNKIPAFNTFYLNKELLNNNLSKLLNNNVSLFACDYGNASRAWYYLKLNRVYVLNQSQFANSYRYWLQPKFPVKNAIYICDNDDKGSLLVVYKYFKHVTLLNKYILTNKISDNKLYIYKINN